MHEVWLAHDAEIDLVVAMTLLPGQLQLLWDRHFNVRKQALDGIRLHEMLGAKLLTRSRFYLSTMVAALANPTRRST